MIRYYLTVSPVEALIASQLSPENFGCYMAVGSRKGSAEQLIFIEIEGGFGDYFDWNYAQQKCVAHPDGKPKCSLYMSIYRVLENTPLAKMRSMYLVTQDGRVLELPKSEYSTPADWKGYALYKELCPAPPLVASPLPPDEFGAYLVGDSHKVKVPAIVFADIRVLKPEQLKDSGNIGTVTKLALEHIHDCIEQVTVNATKQTKTVDRSFHSNFTYQAIETGIYATDASGTVCYQMPDVETLRHEHYDWARSANII